MARASERIHATAIAVGQRAIIIRGPSGSGKSDLALRCLAVAASQLVPSPARLVSDDQVLVTRDGLSLSVTAPQALLGQLEVRGLGIIRVDPEQDAKLMLIADLTGRHQIERYPDPWPMAQLLGLNVPVMHISAFDASSPLKLLTALSMPALPPLSDAG
ncbi:MAG: HPr kinase/phosphatase C-terminal domain-containing protein [Hyphomicrobium sp.]